MFELQAKRNYAPSLVISTIIYNMEFMEVIIDPGSAMDSMSFKCFLQLGYETRDLRPMTMTTNLIGYNRNTKAPVVVKTFSVILKAEGKSKTTLKHFLIIIHQLEASVILGCPTLFWLGAVVSTQNNFVSFRAQDGTI